MARFSLSRLFSRSAPRVRAAKPISAKSTTGIPGASHSLQKLAPVLRMPYTPRFLDANKWRIAIDAANDPRTPNRGPLLDIYRRVVRDAHLRAVMNTRVLKVLSQPYRLTRSGREESALLDRFRGAAIERVLELALQSKFYGHSLIDLVFDAQGGLAQTLLVPREHVEPRRGEILYTPGVLHGNSYREQFSRRGGFQPPAGVYLIAPNEALVEVGDPMSLGLLESAARNVIEKDNALQDWAEFSERFGMPIRYARLVGGGDESMVDQVLETLDTIGAGGSGVYPADVELTLQEANRPDSFRVYVERIRHANEENSKLFGGQTMTTDNGSSRAQAEVHERIFNEIVDADKRFLEDFVNGQVLPLVAAFDPAFEGVRFTWRKWENMSQINRADLYTKLAAMGHQVSRAQIEQEFGVELASDE